MFSQKTSKAIQGSGYPYRSHRRSRADKSRSCERALSCSMWYYVAGRKVYGDVDFDDVLPKLTDIPVLWLDL